MLVWLFGAGGCAAIVGYVRHTHTVRYPPRKSHGNGAFASSSPQTAPAEFPSLVAGEDHASALAAPIRLRWNLSCSMACAATLTALKKTLKRF